MHGWKIKPLSSPSGERALLAAIIRRALRDAQCGNAEAAAWLDSIGAQWAETFLGLDHDRVANWRILNPATRVRLADDVERERAQWRSRGARRRTKARDASGGGPGGAGRTADV